jgi:hypothetical protein
MTVREFVGTLYVGDRGCKAFHLEAWDGSVRVVVDCISRVRDPSGIWGYYTDEDITDGSIVFTGVDRIELQNDGWIPNDLINSIDVIQDGEVSVVELSIDSVRANAARKETRLRIACTSIHLEDPKRPGVKITA